MAPTLSSVSSLPALEMFQNHIKGRAYHLRSAFYMKIRTAVGITVIDTVLQTLGLGRRSSDAKEYHAFIKVIVCERRR